MNTYKVLVPVSDAAWEDWKAFSRLLLTHVNPYSKLRYADDPALAWLAMINDLLAFQPDEVRVAPCLSSG